MVVGITPAGIITFMSHPYRGNTSDRHITEMKLIDKIEPGDAIMVDKGFNIGDLLLHMLPFTRKKEDVSGRALNTKEIVKTREVASLRVHTQKKMSLRWGPTLSTVNNPGLID